MDDKLTKKIERLLTNAVIKNREEDLNYTNTDEDLVLYGNPKLGDIVTDDPSKWQLSNEHATHLIRVAQQMTVKEIKSLDKLLLSRIGDNYRKQIVDAATLYFIHSEKLQILTKHLKDIFTGYQDNGGLLYSLACLRESMRHRPDLFSEDATESIHDWCEDVLYGDSDFSKKIREHKILYEDVLKELRKISSVANEVLTRSFIRQIDTSFNPELNIDEAKVAKEIENVGLSLDLNESLKHINNLFEQANTDFKYRDTLSAIRAFTERFYEQVAKKIDPSTKIDGKDSKEVAKFLKDSKLISQDMAELLVAHRHFLSNDGTHRIKSRKEDARIAKNITIELALYIVTRLRETEK